MEHIAALLLIVGCSPDFKHCEELPVAVPIYETSAECDAELPLALRQSDGTRPRVIGTCVFVDPAVEEEDADLVWKVSRDGRLRASVVTTSFDVAALRGNNSSQ